MSTGMTVYKDFFSYKDGIYCTNGKEKAGGHAIRCVGYGSSPQPHLVCANSWGPNWGMKGFFKISTERACGLNFEAENWSCLSFTDPK